MFFFLFLLYGFFIYICIDVHIIIFKFNVIDEFKTMVVKKYFNLFVS